MNDQERITRLEKMLRKLIELLDGKVLLPMDAKELLKEMRRRRKDGRHES